MASFFETDMGAMAQQRFQVEHELRDAIQEGQLHLYLQPQVNHQDKRRAAEVLIRWEHPSRGLLAPGLFIPIAEEPDLIVDLERWVLSESCKLVASESEADRPLHLSINISPRHFRKKSFVPWVSE